MQSFNSYDTLLGTVVTHKRDRKVAVAAGFGVFQRLVQVAFTLLLMPLVLRALGPAHFGIWGAAASLAWLSGLADIGVGTALVTLVAQAMARDEVDEARTQIAGALGVGSLLAALMLCLTLVAWITVPAIVMVACTVAITAIAKPATSAPSHQLRFKFLIM